MSLTRPVRRIETIPAHGHPQAPQSAPQRRVPGNDAIPVDQAAWEQLVAFHAATDQLLRRHDEMAELLAAMRRPAQMETVVLTPTNPTWESRERFEEPCLSIGILNPNNIPIYFSGIGTAGATTRSPSCPPNNLIVLPISAQMVEVAANPTDLGANNAVCFLLRYFTVQPAFLGKGV